MTPKCPVEHMRETIERKIGRMREAAASIYGEDARYRYFEIDMDIESARQRLEEAIWFQRHKDPRGWGQTGWVIRQTATHCVGVFVYNIGTLGSIDVQKGIYEFLKCEPIQPEEAAERLMAHGIDTKGYPLISAFTTSRPKPIAGGMERLKSFDRYSRILAVIKEIQAEYKDYTLREIADVMNKRGIERVHGSLWNPQGVFYILNRARNARINALEHQGHTSIWDDDQDDPDDDDAPLPVVF